MDWQEFEEVSPSPSNLSLCRLFFSVSYWIVLLVDTPPQASCLHQSPDALHQCAAALAYISAGPLTSIMPPLPVHQHAFTYQPQNTQRTNCKASTVPQPQSTLSPGARLALGGLFSALQIENQSRCGKPA